jgi:hypothetical protein
LAFSVTGVWATYRLEEAFPAVKPTSEPTKARSGSSDAAQEPTEEDLWKDLIQEELSLDKISE